MFMFLSTWMAKVCPLELLHNVHVFNDMTKLYLWTLDITFTSVHLNGLKFVYWVRITLGIFFLLPFPNCNGAVLVLSSGSSTSSSMSTPLNSVWEFNSSVKLAPSSLLASRPMSGCPRFPSDSPSPSLSSSVALVSSSLATGNCRRY